MKAGVFWLHIHHFEDSKRRVWAVRIPRRWRRCRYLIAQQVDIRVPLTTVFRGLNGPQPKAYLRGRGVVRKRGDVLTIQAA